MPSVLHTLSKTPIPTVAKRDPRGNEAPRPLLRCGRGGDGLLAGRLHRDRRRGHRPAAPVSVHVRPGRRAGVRLRARARVRRNPREPAVSGLHADVGAMARKGTVADQHRDLLSPTLAMLRGHPGWTVWIVENVQGAGHLMNVTARLHGGMFKLGVHRPRLFESNVALLVPMCHVLHRRSASTARSRTAERPTATEQRQLQEQQSHPGGTVHRRGREAMGIDWMTWEEIREAIPPAYTEFIGRQLLRALTASVSSPSSGSPSSGAAVGARPAP